MNDYDQYKNSNKEYLLFSFFHSIDKKILYILKNLVNIFFTIT